MGPLAILAVISSNRKFGLLAAAAAASRYSPPPSGRIRNRPNWLSPSLLTNLNALTVKKDSLAKLVGIGLGAVTNAKALGCPPRNCSIGVGLGESGPVALTARRNSRNSSGVRTAKPSTEWPMMSV